MGWALEHWEYLATGVLGTSIIRAKGATALLLNLQQYRVIKPETPPAAGTRGAGGGAPNRSSKASKRLARERARQDIILGGAESIHTSRVNALVAGSVAFFRQLDLLVLAAFFLLTAFVIDESRAQLRGLPRTPLPFLCGVAAILTAIHGLFQVVVSSPFSGTGDKIFSTIVGVFAGFAAGGLLYYAPPAVLGLKLEEATAEFNTFLSWLHVRLTGQVVEEDVKDDGLTRLLVVFLLANTAGFITFLLLTSAVRWTKSFWLATNPADWAKAQIGRSVIIRGLLKLAFIAPAVAAAAGVMPLMEYWQLTPDQLTIVRFGAPFAAAVLQLLVFRPVVQAYLDTGLVTWWMKKHAIMGSERLSAADQALAGTNIWRSVEAINILFGKVAVQALAPPMLLLGLLGLWFCGALLPTLRAQGLLATPAFVIVPGAAFWECFSAFLIWWTCTVWFLATFVTAVFFRFGGMIEVPRVSATPAAA